jgi:AAA domain-containing protein
MHEDGSETADAQATGFAPRLAARLQAAPYALTPVGKDTLGNLWKNTEQRSFVIEPALRVAGYLDLDPTILIADCLLGTLGLVFRLEDDFEQRSRTILDQATYLRHLLLMDSGGDAKPSRRAYGVECVLALPSREAEQHLKSVFRTTARHTGFWHAIGVSILVCASDATPDDASLRRAFSWLLAATRSWLQDPPPAAPERRLTGVQLANYRLPGQRAWTFKKNTPVHLLYGQNGTGKSSMAEALELSVTGAATRLKLKGVPSYADVIRNAQTTVAPSIRLHFDGADDWYSEVTATGVVNPLKPEVPVSSFRLDQDAMDDLSRKGSAQRAEVFLGSFFPDDQGARAALNAARDALDAIVRTLPAEIQTSVQSLDVDQKADAVKSRFAWVTATRPPTLQEIDVCRPVSAESLEALRPLAAGIDDYAKATQFRDSTEFERLFKGLNEALERLRGGAGALIDAIQIARQCLAEEIVRTWRPATQGDDAHEWLPLLERWTEQVALADLAEKHWQISRSLADAGKSGWQANFDVSTVGLFEQQPEALEATLDTLAQLRDKSATERKKLQDLVLASTQPSASTPTHITARPQLTERQVRALNLAGTSLGRRDSTVDGAQPLGRLMEKAFTENETPEFAGVTIGGADNWATELGTRMEAVEKALNNLKDESYVGPVKRREALSSALAASDALKKAAERTKAVFLNELQNERFNAALNELVALFTPARWAYSDLAVTPGIAGGKETLELEISGAKGSAADLLLNTAELNVFTVAMYLLSAIRTKNPLGILLFDDPLQNMDELTVTTLARGLAKVARSFPPAWQLVFLFHGEDDLERFRQEIPAAVYVLEWLAPSVGSSENLPIAADPLTSTSDSTLQELEPIVKGRDQEVQVSV